MFDHGSKVNCYVYENDHQIDFNAVNVVGYEPNYHERIKKSKALWAVSCQSKRD